MDVAATGLAFLLLFTRFSTFIASAPVLGAQSVPVQFKVVLAAFLAAMTLAATPSLIPQVALQSQVTAAGLSYTYLWMLLTETLIGLILALAATMIFAGFQLAGYFIGFQMGFTLANVVDPLSQEQVSVVGQLLFVVSVLLFLATNGHYLLLGGIIESVRAVPPGSFAFGGPSAQIGVEMMQGLFVGALKFSLPVMGTLLVVDAGLGVIARTVPQMNVFMVGLPLKAGVGLAVLMLSFSATAAVMELYLYDQIGVWLGLMRSMRG